MPDIPKPDQPPSNDAVGEGEKPKHSETVTHSPGAASPDAVSTPHPEPQNKDKR